MLKISILGAGYVGLIAATCLARNGNKITLLDIDEAKLETIAGGKSPIQEPGVDDLLAQVPLETTSDFSRMAGADVILICVGTPLSSNGSMSLQCMKDAAAQVADVLRTSQGYCLVVVKSTVIPGTTEEVVIPLLRTSGKQVGTDFGVCMDPEFLREGMAVHDYLNPARLIVGEFDARSGDTLLGLYKHAEAPVIRTNLRTAEMIKMASNAFLGTKISFINEIGNLCKKLDIDTYEVAGGMGYDERIGNKFLNAGLGFGGSCIPKDIHALAAQARQMGCQPRILEGVLDTNEQQCTSMVKLLKKHISLKDSVIGVLGLAFKPGTCDIRESRAIRIVTELLQEGARVKAYDPAAMAKFGDLFPQVTYAATAAEVLDSDAVLIVTEWPEFEDLDFGGTIVIDGRRVASARGARVYEGLCW